MKTKKLKTMTYLSIAVVTLVGGLFSVNAGATGNSNAKGAQLIYQSQAANHSIYGYSSNLGGKASLKPELIYVSQAYSPAIHSYAHSGRDIVAPWNVEYVDTAYGPAIYSYESHLIKKTVEVLPIVIQ